MATTEAPEIVGPAVERPLKSGCANYTTQIPWQSARGAGSTRPAIATQGGSDTEALLTEYDLNEVLRQIRSSWKDRRLSKETIRQREFVLGILENLAENTGRSVVTEDLVSEAVLMVKARYPNEGSQRTYLQALREICSVCGISCPEIPLRRLGAERKATVPEKFDDIYQAYMEYLAARGYAAGTQRNMECIARQLLCFLGTRVDAIGQVTEDDLEAFFSDSLKSWRADRLPKLRQKVRRFARYLVSQHGMPESACRSLDEPMKMAPPPLQVILAEDQVVRLLEAAAATPYRPKRTLAWVSIVVQYAVRSKDLVDLKMEDIDWIRKTITFAYTKTGHPRTFPLTEGVRYALLDYLRHERPVTDSPYVFLPRKRPLTQISNPETFTFRLQSLAKEAGLDLGRGFGCHALRRASATTLLESGLPYSDISMYLNHSQSGTALSGTAMRYLKIHPSRLRTAALEVPYAG